MLPHGIEATDWLDLPEPILHPDAPQLVSARCGESSALLAALLSGEVYRSPLSDECPFALWPWYPEQDEELRGPAGRRAAELGAEMPPWLDDPYEAAFYLRFTGEQAFVELAAELGVVTDELYLSRVPRVEPPDIFVDFEGGQRATHPWVQRFELVERAIDDLNWLTGDHRALGMERVREALAAYTNALSGFDPPARRPVIALSDQIEDEELPDIGELRFEHVFAVADGALLQVSGWLVIVGRDGIRVIERVPGEVQFAAGGLAIIEGWGLGAFDLELADWRTDELDPVQEFGGPLTMPPLLGLYDGQDRSFEMIVSPDARYRWDGDRILRLQDGLLVTEYDVFGDLWEPVDAPPLLAFEDLSTAGQRQTVLDGVTFTHRAPTGYRVRDEAGFAFVLHGDHWRAYVGGRLMKNDEAVATIGVAAHDGAFSADGETLYVLTDTDLIEIAWLDSPRVVHQTPLYRVAGAIEDRHD